MNKFRTFTRLRLAILVALLAAFIAGCANTRQGVEWPALDTITINGSSYIVLAYEQGIELLDPTTGNIAVVRDADGDVILGDNGEAVRWQVDGGEFDNAQFFAEPLPATDDGQATLLFPTYNNKILEFYTETAQPVSPTGIAIGDGVLGAMIDDVEPAPEGEEQPESQNIIIPYRSQGVVALDRASLEFAWRVDTGEGVWASPLLQDGVLYVPSIDHFLYAVDVANGEVLWTVDLEGAVASAPLYYNDALYVGSFSHKLYKISLGGEILDSFEGQNWIWSTPVEYDGDIYYTDLSGNVYALDADTLQVVWEGKPANRGIRPAPIVTEDYVVVASRSGTVYWLDRSSGTIIHEREMEGTPEILSNMLLVEANEELGINETMIVVGATNNRNMVAAFALDNSIPIWVYGR